MFTHTITRIGRRAVFAALPLAVAASLVTTGTAVADVTVERQGEIATALGSEGVSDGVGYKTTVSPDLRTISATVDNGRFVLSADSTNVAVISATGAKISELPLTLATTDGNNVALASVVSEDGRTLQIAPQLSAATTGELKNIATNPDAANHDPVQNGAAAGATIGFLTAAILCIPALAAFIVGYFFCALTSGLTYALTGAVLGAVIGLVIPESIPQVLS
ncbi:hypothetical protein [Nocardia alba]|uniref:DUF8020 domain-containing protein n=1 Tax=Nocardia alba TaxID=225051 RepID=A0A4R1FIQ4_9NOCA|nr:hypothetical protein [Nocardia alba]TCJ94223.1 hypothetical protein DFR71_4820 [Nocardia alba]